MNKGILALIVLLITITLCLAVWLLNSGTPEIEDLRRFTPVEDSLADLLPGDAPHASEARMEKDFIEPGTGAEATQPDLTFRGRVLDLNGQPVAGARVIRGSDPLARSMVRDGGTQGVTHFSVSDGGTIQISRGSSVHVQGGREPGFQPALSRHPSWCAKTDGEGGFAFPGVPMESNPVFLFPPTHPEYAAADHFCLAPRNEEAVLRMHRLARASLEIEVTDDTSGLPVAVFDIRLHMSVTRPDGEKHTWPVRMETGRDGHFRFDDLRFVEGGVSFSTGFNPAASRSSCFAIRDMRMSRRSRAAPATWPRANGARWSSRSSRPRLSSSQDMSIRPGLYPVRCFPCSWDRPPRPGGSAPSWRRTAGTAPADW
jgi:hypothetical protein